MARNKYTGDYRLIEHFDEKGRVKVSYEYIGEPYRFIQPKEKVEREKKLCLAAMAAGWVLFVAALLPHSLAMKRLWIALPYAFCAVPLALLTEQSISIYRAQEPLERRISDQLENHYPARLAVLMLFSGVAAVLSAGNLLLGSGAETGDAVFLVCSSLLYAGAVTFFRRRKWLKTGRSA